MTIACLMAVCITACGDDDEPTVDELLSEETTPIEFQFSGYSYYYGSENILYDYAGSRYVGSDTIRNSTCTINLRQGNHKLIWINGLWPTFPLWGNNGQNKSGVYYDPQAKTVTNFYPDGNTEHIIVYCEKDLEVTPYLMPAQKIEYKPLTCVLKIKVTDLQAGQKGRITGVPSVKSVSLTGDDFSLNNIDLPTDSIRRYEEVFMLCPAKGFDDIQPVVEVTGNGGNVAPTTTLPKFSLKRGYVTSLRGPIFTGSTSDWEVIMEQYRE